MTLRLISVSHTGTVYTRHVLASLGFYDVTPGPWRPEMPRGTPGARMYESHHTDIEGYPVPFEADGRIVVCVRDPILAEISRLNRQGSGQPVEHWARLADWRHLENVYWFRVPPDQSDVDGLAGFLGVESVEVDVTPRNQRPDAHGLKGPYSRGEVPDQLRRQFEWLQGRTDVQALFRGLGYELPWMT